MSGLILPPALKADLQVKADSMSAKALDRALKHYDRSLELVWIKTTIPDQELPSGAHAGRWHVRQVTQLGERYFPITKPDGSYREPDFGVLAEMQARDLHSRRIDDVRPHRHDPLDGPTKEEQLQDEQRRDEMAADVRALKRVAGDDVFRRRMGAGGKAKKGIVGS